MISASGMSCGILSGSGCRRRHPSICTGSLHLQLIRNPKKACYLSGAVCRLKTRARPYEMFMSKVDHENTRRFSRVRFERVGIEER